MTFNFDAAPDVVIVENDETILALERQIASEVLVVSTTG